MKTIVIGASPKEERFSYKAVSSLTVNGHETIALGLRKGFINNTEIITGKPEIKDIHSVSLYINAERQKEFYDYILSLKPIRVIFNPGTENDEFIEILNENNIETVENCTLVMLANDIF